MSLRRAVWVVWAAALWTFLSSPPSLFAFSENTLLRTCLLGIPVALWSARASFSGTFGASRREVSVLAGIVLVAATLRWSCEGLPWHAFNWLEILAERVAHEPEPSWYANGFAVFMRVPYALTGDIETAIFSGNRVAGTLEVLAAWALARLVLKDGRAALAAAAVLAVIPLEVRLAASESMQIVPSLFATTALVGFAAHANSGERAWLAVGTLSLAYAGLTRPDALAVAAAVPFPYLLHRTHALRAAAAWLVALAVVTPLAYLGARAMSSTLGGASGVLVSPVDAVRTWRAALGSLEWPHAQLAFLGLAGLLVTLARRRWFVLGPLVLFLLRVEVAGFDTNFANRWQLVIPQLPVLALGVGALVGLVARRAWVLVPLAVTFLAVVAKSPFWKLDFDQQQEYRFLRDSRAFPDIAKLGLARPVREAKEGEGASFPTYRLPADTPRWTLHDLAQGAAPLPVVYYRGLWCWTREGLTPACRAVEEHFVLEPLDTAPLDEPVFVGPGHPAGATIGFFRVVGRR